MLVDTSKNNDNNNNNKLRKNNYFSVKANQHDGCDVRHMYPKYSAG